VPPDLTWCLFVEGSWIRVGEDEDGGCGRLWGGLSLGLVGAACDSKTELEKGSKKLEQDKVIPKVVAAFRPERGLRQTIPPSRVPRVREKIRERTRDKSARGGALSLCKGNLED